MSCVNSRMQILPLLVDSQFIFQPKTRANSSLTTMLSSVLTLQPLNLLWQPLSPLTTYCFARYHHCWTPWSLVSHGLLTQLVLVEPTSQPLHCTPIISVDSGTLCTLFVPCVPVASDDCFGLPPIFILYHISYHTSKNDIWILDLERIFHHHTLPKTNSKFAPENGWLEDDPFFSQLKQGSLYYQLQTMHVYRETHSNLPYICINFESPKKNKKMGVL